jgi:hypothetical protein
MPERAATTATLSVWLFATAVFTSRRSDMIAEDARRENAALRTF